ncbi:MAG: DUF2510 domain-containing protein [Acidimicrobiia bacterium]
MSDRFEELERLARLLDEGKIDSQEYARLKQEIMGESGDIGPSVPTAPGWYNDPTGKATHQAYWDGDKWTGATRDGPTSSPAGVPPVASSQLGRSGCFWIVIAVLILIVLGAVGALVAVMVAGRTVTESLSQVESVLAPSDGVPIRGLTCATDLTENSIADYGEDAQGFDTIPKALAEFMDFEGKDRPAWSELTVVDPNENPVEFENDRGWVVLRVEFSMLNGGWLFESFEVCADTG